MSNVIRRIGAWGRIAACLALVASSAFAQDQPPFAPNGWIRPRAWNFLIPLVSPYAAPGCQGPTPPATLMRNMVGPHEIGLEDPKGADVWGDIDFYGKAFSLGHEMAPFFPDLESGTWFSLAMLEGSFGPITQNFPNYDSVNYDTGDNNNWDSLITYLNGAIVPLLHPIAAGDWYIRWDNIMGVATTYVENTTQDPIAVNVCTSSDDGIVVLVNNEVVTSLSGCRGTDGDANECNTAILPPGISKITTIVFEGGGGFGFRLALVDPKTAKMFNDGGAPTPEVVFRGTGEGDDSVVGQKIMTLTRSSSRDAMNCNRPLSIDYTLKGANVPGSATVVEKIPHAVGADIAVTAANGGVVTNLNPVGDLPDATVVGDHGCQNWANSSTTFDAGTGVFTSTAYTGGDIWDGGDGFEFAYGKLVGDFDLAIKLLPYDRVRNGGDQHRWGKYGLMARENLTRCAKYTMIQDAGPDREDPVRQAGRTQYAIEGCSGMYEDGGFQAGSSAHPVYMRLTRRGDVFAGWVSDNPGVETDPGNDTLWSKCNTDDDWSRGGVVEAPDSVFVGFANSDHGSNRCFGNVVQFQPLNLAGVPDDDIGPTPMTTITWAGKSAAEIEAGLKYTVSTGSAVGFDLGATVDGKMYQSPALRSDTLVGGNTGPIGIFEDSRDIGNPPVQGLTHETLYDGAGKYTMTCSGGDIWDGGDDFRFAYKAVTGDFVAVCRAQATTVNPAGYRWGRYGLMARWSCDRNAKMMMVETMVPTTVGNDEQDWVRFHYRMFDGVNGWNTDWQQFNGFEFFPREGQQPKWKKLVRRGNTIVGYFAEDNNGQPDHWVLMGQETSMQAMPETVLVGICIQGRYENGATAEFDNVSIEQLPSLATKSVCSQGEVVYENALDGADATDAVGGYTVQRGGAHRPQIYGNRLRMTRDGDGGDATAVWFPFDNSSELAKGFTAEFDAFMTKGNINDNPADGMTFAVVDVGSASGSGVACLPPEGFDQLGAVGTDNQALNSSYDDVTGIYTSISDNNTDIWDCGDDFTYQYAQLTGDFDVSIEITDYQHSSGVGRWGKFGLMARRELTRDSRFTMAQTHGPGEPDPTRQAGRVIHNAGCGGMYEDWLSVPAINIPGGVTLENATRFLRIVRKGDTFRAFASNDARLGTGELDPTADANWFGGRTDVWGPDAPDTVYVGFANSEHGDNPDGLPGTQTIQFRILQCNGGTVTHPVPFPYMCGDGGGALGFDWGSLLWYQRQDEVRSSFAVEFDNWSAWGINDGGRTNDPPVYSGSWRNDGTYHMGIDIHGNATSVQTNAQTNNTFKLPNIYQPEGVHAKVQYKPDGWVDVWVSDNADPGADPIHVLSANVPTLKGGVVLGFTGGTGGATFTAEFDNLVVTQQCCEGAADSVTIKGPSSVNPGGSATLEATFTGADAGLTVSYSWTTDKGTISGTGAIVTLSGVAAGETATVNLSANDGICSGATASILVPFIACPTVTAEITGAPAELANGSSVQLGANVSPPEAIIAWASVSGPGTLSPTGLLTATADSGDIVVTLAVTLANGCPGAQATVTVKAKKAGTPFKRGDADSSGALNLTDAVNILGYLFLGNPKTLECENAADVDNSNAVNLTDAVNLLGYLFLGNPKVLVAPGEVCGLDPDAADVNPPNLPCPSFAGCP